MSKVITKEIELGGRKLKLEVGRFAQQATAAVYAQYGETTVLATVVSGASKEDAGYLPLSVEIVERLYAGGRIKGSRWVKREGRTSDAGTLTGRLIDRSLRPLFPKNYFNEVQVTVTILSVDMKNDPDVLSVIAASAALAISPIPWNGPIGAVRVGLKDEKNLLNPIVEDQVGSTLDLVVSATNERVVMIEGGAAQVPEADVLKGMYFGQEEAQPIIGLINDLVKEVGQPKLILAEKKFTDEVAKQADKFVQKEVDRIFAEKTGSSGENSGTALLKDAFLADLPAEQKKEGAAAFEYYWKKHFRAHMLKGERCDGRKTDEVRPIEVEVGVLPRTHGSALFKRGATQVLSVTTLGTPAMQQLIESASGEEKQRYIHHYSMPPYATGETGRMGGVGRREIGHGALASRALEPVIPTEESFPYTIRIVSEVLSSNGSSSMASTCGSTLSLMDAGVPITDPISGVAMGLVTGDKQGADDEFLVLTDIAGQEDYNGDMDIKVTGSTKGITAIQLDVKVPGLTHAIIEETLTKARIGRLFILAKMLAVIDKPRAQLSQYAPRLTVLHIDPEKIGEVIGPGGKMIRKLIEETGAMIDIDDDGSVNISGPTDEALKLAVDRITGLTTEAVIGQTYEGEVKRIENYGAFIEYLPGKEGLCHVSQMSTGFVNDPNTIVKMGQKVKVKVNGKDERGRVDLTMLVNGEVKEEAPRNDRPPMDRPPMMSRRPFTGGGNFNRSPGGFRPANPAGSGYPSRYMPQSKYGR